MSDVPAKDWANDKLLAAAVLWDAYESLRNRAHHINFSEVSVTYRYQKDLAWVLSNKEGPWSFVRICQLHDLDPDAVREKWKSEGILDGPPTKRLKAGVSRGRRTRQAGDRTRITEGVAA